MTVQTLLLIIGISFAVVATIAILVVTYILGKRSIRDNPAKALVLVNSGGHIDNVFKADLSETSKHGFSFFYGGKRVVFYPRKYKPVYHKQRVLIFIDKLGQLIASPFGDDKALSDDERDALIYEMCATHIGADGMRALRGKATAGKVIVIALIAFILGAGVVIGFQYMQSTMKQKATPPTPTQTVPVQPNVTIQEVE